MTKLRMTILVVIFSLVSIFGIGLFSSSVQAQSAPPAAPPTAPPTETTDTTSGSCESEGGEFTFILCPLLRGANEGVEFLDGKVREILEVNPEYLQDEADGTTGGVRTAWARIRNVAYIILIPVMLFMVIGTALGFSFLDAYTVKRALPRMLVAVIFMAISFDFGRILIESTNAIGRGVAGLIAQPFGGASNLQLTDIFEPGVGEEGFLAVSGPLAGIALFGIGAVSLGILGSYLLTAAVALLIIFFILTLRELLIIFLVIMSPIAIISWIFPGNDKLWKLWWGTFSKMLLLYPLIISILMIGRGFASIVNSTTGASDTGSLFTTLIKLTAYIGPFFFIPKAFQFAGGAFANLAGMVNDRGKGFFDQRRKGRAEARKKNRERIAGDKAFRGGNLKNKRGRWNEKFSRAYGHVDAAKEGGIIRYATAGKAKRARGVDAIQARNVRQHFDHLLEDKDIAEWIGYDDLTGLSAAVASGDEETLKGVLKKKYRYKGDVDAVVADIMNDRNSGNLRGALSKAFAAADDDRNIEKTEDYVESTGGNFALNSTTGQFEDVGEGNGTHRLMEVKGEQAFNGDSRFREISLEQVTNAFRKHGDEALIQAMTMKALAGGTFYRDAGDSWDAVLASVTHNGHVDRNSLANMAIKGRQVLLATGRPEGAASFGATMGMLSDLEEGMKKIKAKQPVTVEIAGQKKEATTETELRTLLSQKLMNTVYDQKGAAIFTHPDIKTAYIRDNVIPVIRARIKNAHQKAVDSGQFDERTAADGTTVITATSEEYKAEIAAAENLLKTYTGSKPEATKLFADQIFSYDPQHDRSLTAQEQIAQNNAQKKHLENMTSYKIEKQRYDAAVQEQAYYRDLVQQGITHLPDGRVVPGLTIDPQRGPVLTLPTLVQPVEPVQPAYVETVRTSIGKFQDDPVYQNHANVWQAAELSWRQTVNNAQLLLLQQELQQQQQRNAGAGGGLGGPGIGGPGIGGGGLGGGGL